MNEQQLLKNLMTFGNIVRRAEVEDYVIHGTAAFYIYFAPLCKKLPESSDIDVFVFNEEDLKKIDKTSFGLNLRVFHVYERISERWKLPKQYGLNIQAEGGDIEIRMPQYFAKLSPYLDIDSPRKFERVNFYGIKLNVRPLPYLKKDFERMLSYHKSEMEKYEAFLNQI